VLVLSIQFGAQALSYVVGELDDAATFVDRALVLNPNLAGAWYASWRVRVHRGEPEIAIEHFACAMRLTPLDPQMIAMGRKKQCAQANYLTSIRIAAASKAACRQTHGSARGRGSFA
jgi:tetratricopeptide (TPR) repeat protein